MIPEFVVWLSLAFVAFAHDDASNGYPKVVGGRHFAAQLRSRNILAASKEFPNANQLAKRANCGPGIGSCAAGFCCSSGGFCGQGPNYCSGPDCQFLYGPACDANTVPAGGSTAGISRPQVGSVPYGSRINDCTRPNVFALTFDDGPFSYTEAILDLLDKYNAKATFFITGNNLGKGSIDGCATNYPKIIKRMHAAGHQIASHTWTHQNLNTLAATDFQNQLVYNEMALRNILGVIPTYFRPPYVDCNAACFSRLGSLGYHVIYYDLDTFDYANDDVSMIQNSKNYFTNYINPHPSNVLVLSHDTHYQTVYNLTKFMLDTMATNGYGTSVTVGTCLGDPPANWYRSAGSAVTCGTPPPLVVSTGGNCSGGITCQGSVFGNCCSKYNFCGSSTDYCAIGCQEAFGSCVVASSTITPSLSSTFAPSSTISKSTTASVVVTTTTKSLTTVASSSSTTSVAPPSGTLTISTTGRCGTGITCQSSKYGNCCSRYGYCGSSVDHCGSFCQPSFGTCNPANPSATSRVSTDGSCGNGITCIGSSFGSCCSKYNFCGTGATYCGTGCQVAFGTCT